MRIHSYIYKYVSPILPRDVVIKLLEVIRRFSVLSSIDQAYLDTESYFSYIYLMELHLFVGK